jgi:hypothetical protein
MNRRTFLALSAALVTAPAVAAFSRPQNPEKHAPRWTKTTDVPDSWLAIGPDDLDNTPPAYAVIPDVWSEEALRAIDKNLLLSRVPYAMYRSPVTMDKTVDGLWVVR